MLRKLLLTTAVVAVLLFGFSVVAASAANPPGAPGQPSQTCLTDNAQQEPGQAASSPGSAFNEDSGIGGSNYSETSQYDVACFQVSQPHP